MLSCLPGFGGQRGGKSPHQLVLLGLEGAGKTTLLYHLKIPNWKEICKDIDILNKRKDKADPGYHYEELSTNPLGTYGVWDVPGNEVMISLWSTFYRYVQVAGLLFVVDGSEDTWNALSRDKYDAMLHKVRRLVSHLLNEDELRGATFTLIINHRDSFEEDGRRGKDKDKGSDYIAAHKKVQKERFDHIKHILQVKPLQEQAANKGRFHIHEFNCEKIKHNGPEWGKVVREIYEMTIVGQ